MVSFAAPRPGSHRTVPETSAAYIDTVGIDLNVETSAERVAIAPPMAHACGYGPTNGPCVWL
jgi:hypothetical protein